MRNLLILSVFFLGFFEKNQAQKMQLQVVEFPSFSEDRIHELGINVDFLFETAKSHHHIFIGFDGELGFVNGWFLGETTDIYNYFSISFDGEKYVSIGLEKILDFGVETEIMLYLEAGTDFESPTTVSLGLVYNLQISPFKTKQPPP